jgi:hypothetical protein
LVYENSIDLTIVKAPEQLRENLVFIRAGGDKPWPFSIGWHGQERNFDIAASYFAEPDVESDLYRNADFILSGGLSKFHAGQLFLQNSARLDHYQYVFFVDDDVEFLFSVDDFIAFCKQINAAVAQASLTYDSYFTFSTTRHHPGLVFRTTNYVETMCPLFKAAHLKKVLGMFDKSISSYGLDIYWSVAIEPGQVALITDCFQMRHLRPISDDGNFYRYLESIGVNRWDDLKNIMDLLNITEFKIVPTAFGYTGDKIVSPGPKN